MADSLNELKKLTDLYEETLATIADLEEKLSSANAIAEKVGGHLIPNLLKENGLSEIKLADKRKVQVTKDIRVVVKDEAKLHKYLEKHQAGHYIKFNLSTAKLTDEQREALFGVMSEQEINYTADNKVHGGSLKKYVKDVLGLNLSEDQYARAYEDGMIANREEIAEILDIKNINKTKIK